MGTPFRPLALLLLLLPAGAKASGTERQSPTPRTITVRVESTVLSQPSTLHLACRVVAEAGSEGEALNELTAELARVEEHLRGAGPQGLRLSPGPAELGGGPSGGNGEEFFGMGAVVMLGAAMPTDPGSGGAAPSAEANSLLECVLPAPGDGAAQLELLGRTVDAMLAMGLTPSRPAPVEARGATAPGGAAMPVDFQVFGGEAPAAHLTEGRLDSAAREAAEQRAQAQALERARARAASLCELAGQGLGTVHQIQQTRMTSTWAGVGRGVETRCELEVSFHLQ